MRRLVLIAHNLRSNHNIGSLLRTAEGLGVECVYLTGYTPHPGGAREDQRLPHEQIKASREIHKTALGAETLQPWVHRQDLGTVLTELEHDGFTLVAVEQTETALALPSYQPPAKVALIIGREVEGIEAEVLARCAATVVIPMFGQKESFNVVQAAAMALYHCRFSD